MSDECYAVCYCSACEGKEWHEEEPLVPHVLEIMQRNDLDVEIVLVDIGAN